MVFKLDFFWGVGGRARTNFWDTPVMLRDLFFFGIRKLFLAVPRNHAGSWAGVTCVQSMPSACWAISPTPKQTYFLYFGLKCLTSAAVGSSWNLCGRSVTDDISFPLMSPCGGWPLFCYLLLGHLINQVIDEWGSHPKYGWRWSHESQMASHWFLYAVYVLLGCTFLDVFSVTVFWEK